MIHSKSIDIQSVLVLILLIVIAALPALATPPSFMGLSGLPGASPWSSAHGVSDDGSVVVGYGQNASQNGEAFRWTQAGGMIGLGTTPGGATSLSYGASGDGSVVVGTSEGSIPTTAFRWTQGGGMVALDDVPGGGHPMEAFGVSGDGSAVVGYGNPPNLHTSEAFRWTQGGGVNWLGFLPGPGEAGSHGSVAKGISADGSVVVGGGSSNWGQVVEAFRWTQAGGIVGLGDLPGGTFNSTAYQVSANGSVVVGYGNNALGGEAFRWTQAGGMVGLGVLPLGSHSSTASDVSADGSVIVGTSDSETGFQDFIWDAQHGMRSLQDVLVNDLGLDLTGWTLNSHINYRQPAISADGLTIVGTGVNLFGGGPFGAVEAYVAHIPEPSTLALLAMAACAASRGRRRRSAKSQDKQRVSAGPCVNYPTRITCFVVALAVALHVVAAQADVFNMPMGLTSVELVHVGDLGNPAEPSGVGAGGFGPSRDCGSVDYSYDIGKFEITTGQYTEFLNAVAATDPYGLYNTMMWTEDYGSKIQRTGNSGSFGYSVSSDRANRPVNFANWGDAARFANWLTNGQPSGNANLSTTEDGSYFLNGATSSAALMAVTRKSNARYVIPSEDEWYKAAYYDPHKPGGAGYWDYPTGSDTVPSNDLTIPDQGNSANFEVSDYDWTLAGPYYRTEVGAFSNSASPYGTFDQGGNIMEFNEAVVNPGQRGIRGGYYRVTSNLLLAGFRGFHPVNADDDALGIRIARVPEPATLALLALAACTASRRRRRRSDHH